MRIHREGINILIVAALIVMAINLIVWFYLPILLPLTVLGAVVLLGLMLNFFRNPLRQVVQVADHLIYSPADGHVVVIEEVEETEYFKDKRLQVSVFMSIYDVHANRTPIAGQVSYFKYHPGKYLLARNPKSSTENERNTVVIQNQQATVLIRQIAGAVARRIRSYVQTGDRVEQGQEFGFIKFGSRADIFLPLDAQLKVKIGDKVKAGIDLIATVDTKN